MNYKYQTIETIRPLLIRELCLKYGLDTIISEQLEKYYSESDDYYAPTLSIHYYQEYNNSISEVCCFKHIGGFDCVFCKLFRSSGYYSHGADYELDKMENAVLSDINFNVESKELSFGDFFKKCLIDAYENYVDKYSMINIIIYYTDFKRHGTCTCRNTKAHHYSIKLK